MSIFDYVSLINWSK